jgi:hypothetical protein
MATGVKKGIDPKLLSHIMWAAWGVIDIEKLGREPRRNYILTVRAELETRGYSLEVGGIAQRPFYRIYQNGNTEDPNKPGWATQWSVNSSSHSVGSFGFVCKQFLEKEDPDHATAGSAAAG